MSPNARRILAALMTLALSLWGLFALTPPPAVDRSSQALQEQSQTLFRAQRWAEALGPTQRLHEAFPENHIFISRLAEIQGHLGHFAEEAALWEEFMLRSPDPGGACPAIGDAYAKQGKLREAVNALERCQALEPRNPDFAFHLARAYESAGMPAKAKAIYGKWMMSNPGYPDFKIGFAKMEFFHGSTAKAHGLIQEVLVSDPDYADALLVQGMILRSLGRTAEAKATLEKGIRLKPGYTDFYIVLGGIAEKEDDRRKAIDCYTRALALNPDKPDVARRLQKLQKGRS